MKKILVLLNHPLTAEQLAEIKEMGYEPEYLKDDEKRSWGNITPDNMIDVVDSIFINHHSVSAAIIAGQPAATVYAVNVFNSNSLPCFYAYSVRESVERTEADGSVIKQSIFRHKGFYEYIV